MKVKQTDGIYYCPCGSEMEVTIMFAAVCKECWNVFDFKFGWMNGLKNTKIKTTIEIDKLLYAKLNTLAYGIESEELE